MFKRRPEEKNKIYLGKIGGSREWFLLRGKSTYKCFEAGVYDIQETDSFNMKTKERCKTRVNR